jgi:hypothetical protein
MIKKFIRKRSVEIIFVAMAVISYFLVNPKLEQYYLKEDMDRHFWVYYFIALILLSFTLLIIWTVNKAIKNTKFKDIFIIGAAISLFSLFFHFIIKDITLSINLLGNNGIVEKQFVVNKYDVNGIIIFNSNEQVDNPIMIKNIDKKRILVGQTSIENLKPNDTLVVEFKKGLFGIDYFK